MTDWFNYQILAALTGLPDFRLASAVKPEAARAARAIAEAHGFVERNPQAVRKRRRLAEELAYSFTARVRVRSAIAFIE